MSDLGKFKISEEARKHLEDDEFVIQHFADGKTFQELFGFSNDVLIEFYEAAKSILEQKRFDDAVKAFTFITTLNPNVSDFWLGLGMSQTNNNEQEAAISSYKTAYQLNGKVIVPYMLAAQCYMDVHDYKSALEVLDEADKYAEVHTEEVETRQLLIDAAAAKHYVKSKGRL